MSKAYGGRITDSQIVFDSGMMEKLESGDSVMCDKGFPEVRYCWILPEYKGWSTS